MASEKTTELQLNIWKPTDNVSMAEFNENFQKIDSGIFATEQKIDNEIQQVNQQLAQTKEKVYKAEVRSRTSDKFQIVIVDDDGNPRFLSLLYPLAVEYNIPVVSAIITSRVSTNEASLTLGQMQSIKDSVQFVSHTHNHLNLATLTDSEVYYELNESKKWLNANGFDGNYIVYPFGGYNKSVITMVNQLYRAGVGIQMITNNSINKMPYETSALYRYSFDDNTIEDIKVKIDQAKATNGLLILVSHTGYTDWSSTKMRETIEYGLSQGAEFVNLEKALDQTGNVVDIQSKEGNIVVAANGAMSGVMRNVINADNYSSQSVITDFPEGKTVCYFLASVATGFPGGAGTLETYRAVNALYSYQEYTSYSDKQIYRRYWSAQGWTAWDRITVVYIKDITNSTLLSEFKYGVTASSVITSNATGFPDNAIGSVMTYKLSSQLNANYQRFTKANNAGEYVRFAKTDGTWDIWREEISQANAIKTTSASANITGNKDIVLENGIYLLTITVALATENGIAVYFINKYSSATEFLLPINVSTSVGVTLVGGTLSIQRANAYRYSLVKLG